jgi:hypothetical protein
LREQEQRRGHDLPANLADHPSPLYSLQDTLQIPRSGNARIRAGPDILNNHGPAVLARYPDINDILTKATALLEEVVRLSRSPLPSPPAVGADLELGDGLGGVHDLHGEPPAGGALLVLEDEGRGDPAGRPVPGDVDDALGNIGELGEGVLEEVEVAGFAFGALVDDLGHVS